MGKYLKKFENHTQYDAYINGSGAILPNVSICTTEGDVHYNPSSLVPPTPTETRLVAKFNVTDTSNPTSIISEYAYSPFSAIEIDGVEQPSVVSSYTFSTTGEHIVKYTLTDPTSIEENAFKYCSDLTSVTIPNGVTSIGAGAFVWCTSLISITIPDSVISIGSNAFSTCRSLTSIDIPSSVTFIEDGAFCDCRSLDATSIAAIETINEYALVCG